MPNEAPVVLITELAELSGVHEWVIRRLYDQGRLNIRRPFRIETRRMFLREELGDVLARLRELNPKPRPRHAKT